MLVCCQLGALACTLLWFPSHCITASVAVRAWTTGPQIGGACRVEECIHVDFGLDSMECLAVRHIRPKLHSKVAWDAEGLCSTMPGGCVPGTASCILTAFRIPIHSSIRLVPAYTQGCWQAPCSGLDCLVVCRGHHECGADGEDQPRADAGVPAERGGRSRQGVHACLIGICPRLLGLEQLHLQVVAANCLQPSTGKASRPSPGLHDHSRWPSALQPRKPPL